MVWIRKLRMIASITSMNQSGSNLPADVFPAGLALSTTRKLRSGYDGPLFRFRDGSSEFDYPSTPLTPNARLVRIYDQTEQNDAIQLDAEKQPEIEVDANGKPYAQFTKGQHLSVASVASEISNDFVITAIGDGDFPRPMVLIEGTSDSISIEPGSPTKFKFNNRTAISRNAASTVNQYTSGASASQNGDQVITIRSDGGENGQSLGVDSSPSFDSFHIGGSSDENFEGKFMELVLHIDAPEGAMERVWGDACLNY